MIFRSLKILSDCKHFYRSQNCDDKMNLFFRHFSVPSSPLKRSILYNVMIKRFTLFISSSLFLFRATREFLDREENMVIRENRYKALAISSVYSLLNGISKVFIFAFCFHFRGEPGCLEDMAGRDKEESGYKFKIHLITLGKHAVRFVFFRIWMSPTIA